MKAEDAWDLAYETMGDVDDTKVTKCAEAFVILLEAVTGKIPAPLLIITTF